MVATVARLREMSAGAFKNIADDAELQPYLDLAEAQIGLEWGECRELACIYLAAHFAQATQLGQQGAAGTVTSATAGGLTAQYANISVSESNGYLSSTRFGQLFLLLRQSCGIFGATVVRGGVRPDSCCRPGCSCC